MKCSKVRGMLPDYIGAELSAQKRKQVDGHLQECPDCKAALGELQQVWDGLTNQPLPHKDERFWNDLTKGVMREIKGKGSMPAKEKRGFLFPGWRVLLPATAAVAIAIIIVGLIAVWGSLWGPQGSAPWTAQGEGDQQALGAAPSDLAFGPLAQEVDGPLEQEVTLQEVSLVAEALNTSIQPANGTTVTDVLTELYNGKDQYWQLEDLTEGEFEEFDQLLSEKYPYS